MSKKHRKQRRSAQAVALSRDQPVALVRTHDQDQWPALTGLRGLAAFAVLCLHAYETAGKPVSVPQPFAWLFSIGWSGVDVFFTLSAFLLTLPYLRAEFDGAAAPRLGEYAWRRAVRILPAYYVQIAILLLLGALGIASSWAWNSPSLPRVLAHLLFYVDAWPTIQPQVPPWWTLPVEVGFYVLLPLFARLLRPGRWPWLLLAIAASLGYRFWLMHAGLNNGQAIDWVEHLPGRLHQFLIGMLAAYAYFRLKARSALPSAKSADLLAVAATVLFLLLPAVGYLVSDRAFQGGPISNPLLLCWHFFASLVIGTLLIALLAGAPKMGRLFSSAPLRGLGLISYSLYLWHYPLMLGLRSELGGFAAIRSDFWPFYFYCVLISVSVAIASWWLVERPAQQWGRRVASARQ